MKRTLILFAALSVMLGACAFSGEKASSAAASEAAPVGEGVVRPGIEVLRSRGFEGLKGKRVGLVTNPSGIDRSLRSTIDILFEAP